MISFDIHFGPLKGGQRISKNRVEAILRSVERVMKLKGKRKLSIAFVSVSEMRKLNEAYHGGKGVTDVLAFPYKEIGTDEGYIGEVVIHYPRAALQAKKRGASTKSEVELLLVHGVLHLLGEDHDTKQKHARMFRLQDRVIEKV